MAMIDKKLKMNNSPHIIQGHTTKKIMLDVIIALMPALIAGVIFFGLYSLVIVALSILTCVASEYLYNKIRKKPITVGDLSSVVTGLILGLNMPPSVPFYIPIIGGVFAIILVKMLFGGIGKNFANPAAAARVFLLLAYASMTKFILPSTVSGNHTGFGELTTAATYLSGGALQETFLGLKGLRAINLQLFLGAAGGSIGETSALAIIIGFVYLMVRRVIDYKIPLTVVLTSAFFAAIFSGSINYVLPQLLSGGLLFGAVFMATDYSTSPMTGAGKIFFGFGIGLITMLIRFYGVYPEGMSLAILFMNLLVPLIDKYIIPVRFGEKRLNIMPIVSLCVLVVMGIGVVVSAFVTHGRYSYAACDIISTKRVSGGYEIVAKGYVNAEDKKEENYKNGSVTLKIYVKGGEVLSVEVKDHILTPLPGGKEDTALTAAVLDQYKGGLLDDYTELQTGSTSRFTLRAVNNCFDGVSKWYSEELKGGRA